MEDIEFDEHIISHMDNAICACMDDLEKVRTACENLENMINSYKSLKNKFKENDLENLTEYEKQLSMRIGATIIKEEFYDNIHNTKSKAKLVVDKNEKIKNQANNFKDYFEKKFNL